MARFEFDPTASLLSFSVGSSMHRIHAETSGLEGWIDVELTPVGGAKVVAGRVQIPLDGLSSGNSLNDSELRRFIDTRRHPTAEGVLAEWEPTDRPGVYRVRGEVSFHGVSRQVEDVMKLSVEDVDAVMLEGSSVFDIREFGVTPPRVLMAQVYPDVTVMMAVVGRRVS